jgi:hypothetical protein
MPLIRVIGVLILLSSRTCVAFVLWRVGRTQGMLNARLEAALGRPASRSKGIGENAVGILGFAGADYAIGFTPLLRSCGGSENAGNQAPAVRWPG